MKLPRPFASTAPLADIRSGLRSCPAQSAQLANFKANRARPFVTTAAVPLGTHQARIPLCAAMAQMLPASHVLWDSIPRGGGASAQDALLEGTRANLAKLPAGPATVTKATCQSLPSQRSVLAIMSPASRVAPDSSTRTVLTACAQVAAHLFHVVPRRCSVKRAEAITHRRVYASNIKIHVLTIPTLALSRTRLFDKKGCEPGRFQAEAGWAGCLSTCGTHALRKKDHVNA